MTEKQTQQSGFGFADLSKEAKLHLIYNDLGLIHAKLDQIATKVGLVQQTNVPQTPVEVKKEVDKEQADSIVDIM